MLHKIVAVKKREIEALDSFDLTNLPPTRPFIESLKRSERKVSVIAEVKKASPSKGIIREDFHPVELAKAYASARVEAISVLTDTTFFKGSTEYLRAIRQAVDTPLLRKDFIIDERQIAEARFIGADCILLIAAILDKKQLKHFYETARALDLDVLIEVHDEAELDLVLSTVDTDLIGINNRNLKTFETTLQTTERLMKVMPKGVTVISESGISSPSDIRYLQSLGVRGVLVGEHFMRQPDAGQAVLDLVGVRACV